MSSRALSESELQQLIPTPIALDGIAVVVNRENPVLNLTKSQVRAVFAGEAKTWSDVSK
jgi:phosphate transport system substrate-binding protein